MSYPIDPNEFKKWWDKVGADRRNVAVAEIVMGWKLTEPLDSGVQRGYKWKTPSGLLTCSPSCYATNIGRAIEAINKAAPGWSICDTSDVCNTHYDCDFIFTDKMPDYPCSVEGDDLPALISLAACLAKLVEDMECD